MARYIATYFYEDVEDLGASYGNIFSSLLERNQVYWKTIYLLFYSSIHVNAGLGFQYIFFTNTSDFPYKDQLLDMGVQVSSDLHLSSRNSSKWATVKFFFDVLVKVANSYEYSNDDAFVLLDTDVVALNCATSLFDFIENSPVPVVHRISRCEREGAVFHGLELDALQKIYSDLLYRSVCLREFLGGEFFGVTKRVLLEYIEEFSILAKSQVITTEEQVLSLSHAYHGFSQFPKAIYRVWTTLRVFDVPNDALAYTFLHCPSEKEYGLMRLFERVFRDKAVFKTRKVFFADILIALPFHRRVYWYYRLVLRKIMKILI